MSGIVTFNQVYIPTSSKGFDLGPVAIKPKILGNRIEWQDFNRCIYKNFTDINTLDTKKIVLITPDHETITLIKLPLDIYNSTIRKVLDSPEFSTEQEMENYFLED